jgi:hypothetical protein
MISQPKTDSMKLKEELAKFSYSLIHKMKASELQTVTSHKMLIIMPVRTSNPTITLL